MVDVRRTLGRIAAMLFCLQIALSLFGLQQALALEEIMISYAGPSITFLPAEIARQRGFFREQNLDVNLILTRSEVDRAALASGIGLKRIFGPLAALAGLVRSAVTLGEEEMRSE